MVIGNNGILNQASTAGRDTRRGSEKEQVEMAFLAAKTLKLTDTDTSSSVVDKADLETALKNMGLVVEGNNPDVTVTGEPSNFTVTFKSGNVYKLADDIVTWDREKSGVLSTPETPSTSKVYLDPAQWDYTVENGEATITKYKVSGATTVTIPNYIKGSGSEADIPVTKIKGTSPGNGTLADASGIWTDIADESAYVKQQTTITKIIVSEGIKEIEEYAFFGTANLTEVTLPNSLIKIGTYAFFSCSSLSNVTIPNSVRSIDGGAFYQCDKLTTINFLGTELEWNNTNIGSNNFANATITFK